MKLFIYFLAFLSLGALHAQDGKPVDIRADEAEGVMIDSQQADILRGHVEIRYENVVLTCDSAYNFKKKNIVKAFSRVLIREGDSVQIQGDSLYYSPDEDLALMRGNVRLKRGEMNLRTQYLTYYPDKKRGFYTGGGSLDQGKTHLISRFGYYGDENQWARFKERVYIKGENFQLWADTLDYDVKNERVHFFGPTVIESDKSRIYCERGYYDLQKKEGLFYMHARILDRGRAIRADTIIYHQKDGSGIAIGQVYFSDSAQGISLFSGRAIYDNSKNAVTASGDPLLLFDFDGDTVFVKSDTMQSTGDSSNRSVHAWPSVRLKRDEFRAIGGDMRYSASDSILQLTGNPVAWVDSFQLTGDSILLKFRNSKPHRLTVKPNAILASREAEGYYSQSKGRTMTGTFRNDSLRSMHFNGNAETIYYAKDDSSRFIGANRLTCSDIHIRFEKGEVSFIRFITLPDGRFTPITRVNPKEMMLPGFQWYGDKRPDDRTFQYPEVVFEPIIKVFDEKEADELPKVTPKN